MSTTVRGWHFTAAKTLPNDDGRRIILGKTLKVKGEIVPCQHGLHASASALDALKHAPGPILWRVELGGTIVPHGSPTDKYAASERTALAGGIDVSPMLLEFARKCALSVIHLWDAPAVVREYLETGKEDLRAAAWDAAAWAAGAATRAAAWAAAWAEARAAAGAAAWAAGAATRAAARAAAWAAGAATRAAAWDAAWAAAWADARAAAWAAARDAAGAAAWAAAWDAAGDAAWAAGAATRAAAWDAAGDAAWDAARAERRAWFEALCLAAVGEEVPHG